MGALRISELAQVSGFTPATLRYYETVGLLDPARDLNGCRRYGDADVERLRLVARAKALGLRLEEIAELADLRGDGACPPVRDRLARLVVDKLADTRRPLAALSAFDAELSRLTRQIDATEAPAACGEGGGCLDHPITASPPPPVVCTLDVDGREARQRDWRTIVEGASASHPTADGRRLCFRAEPGLAARIAALAANEQRCCAFFAFTLELGRDQLSLGCASRPRPRPSSTSSSHQNLPPLSRLRPVERWPSPSMASSPSPS